MKTFLEFLSDFKENLVLKKRPSQDGKFQFVVDSDLEDRKLAGNETYKKKDKIKSLGFIWDKSLGKWVSKPYDQIEFSSKISTLKKQIASLNDDFNEKSFQDMTDELEEYLELGVTDKLKQVFNDLKEKILQTQNSPEIQEFLRFSAKFTNRSLNNQLFIFIQNKNATHVEGMATWRNKFGRKVKKGARAIKIWVPVTYKSKQKEEDAPQVDTNVDETKQPTRFTIGNVFDIADTEPIEGKEHLYVKEPKWYDDSTPDETTRYIYDALLEFAKDNNINVSISAEGLGQARGVSRKGSIQLMQENIPVMIHELAHEILHTIERRKGLEKARLEFEAEGVNYLVCSHYGLPNKQAQIYLSLWLRDKEGDGGKKVEDFFKMIKENEDVINTAQSLINYIDEKTMETKSQEQNNQSESMRSWFST